MLSIDGRNSGGVDKECATAVGELGVVKSPFDVFAFCLLGLAFGFGGTYVIASSEEQLLVIELYGGTEYDEEGDNDCECECPISLAD